MQDQTNLRTSNPYKWVKIRQWIDNVKNQQQIEQYVFQYIQHFPTDVKMLGVALQYQQDKQQFLDQYIPLLPAIQLFEQALQTTAQPLTHSTLGRCGLSPFQTTIFQQKFIDGHSQCENDAFLVFLTINYVEIKIDIDQQGISDEGRQLVTFLSQLTKDVTQIRNSAYNDVFNKNGNLLFTQELNAGVSDDQGYTSDLQKQIELAKELVLLDGNFYKNNMFIRPLELFLRQLSLFELITTHIPSQATYLWLILHIKNNFSKSYQEQILLKQNYREYVQQQLQVLNYKTTSQESLDDILQQLEQINKLQIKYQLPIDLNTLLERQQSNIEQTQQSIIQFYINTGVNILFENDKLQIFSIQFNSNSFFQQLNHNQQALQLNLQDKATIAVYQIYYYVQQQIQYLQNYTQEQQLTQLTELLNGLSNEILTQSQKLSAPGQMHFLVLLQQLDIFTIVSKQTIQLLFQNQQQHQLNNKLEMSLHQLNGCFQERVATVFDSIHTLLIYQQNPESSLTEARFSWLSLRVYLQLSLSLIQHQVIQNKRYTFVLDKIVKLLTSVKQTIEDLSNNNNVQLLENLTNQKKFIIFDVFQKLINQLKCYILQQNKKQKLDQTMYLFLQQNDLLNIYDKHVANDFDLQQLLQFDIQKQVQQVQQELDQIDQSAQNKNVRTDQVEGFILGTVKQKWFQRNSIFVNGAHFYPQAQRFILSEAEEQAVLKKKGQEENTVFSDWATKEFGKRME